jgi:hypothetical protein
MLQKYDIIDMLSTVQRIDVKKLPSMGLFYKDDMRITIKKAEPVHQVTYLQGIDVTDSMSVSQGIKYIVKNCSTFSKGYTFHDLRSCDIMFIFLKIVSFTNGKPLVVTHLSKNTRTAKKVEFNEDNFNYFKIPEDIMKKYDSVNKVFFVDRYGYSPPTVGVESCLTYFFMNAHMYENADFFENAEYDFLYFLRDKTSLDYSEIENLVWAFNHDLDDVEQTKVKKIVEMFKGFTDYSLLCGDEKVSLASKIDLGDVW